ncbi:MAG TPA: hypothetical protein VMI75_13240 [Polyangiaceae bacterium]|nr:hypothetical protein [Polyangiaceae bacterium]
MVRSLACVGAFLLLILALACSGKVAATPDAGGGAAPQSGPSDAGAIEADTDATPVEAQSPTPCPADMNAECSSHFVRVDWYAPDGGLDRCVCLPQSDVSCMMDPGWTPDAAPPETPLGPSTCECNVCGPERVQTWRCVEDVYYGYITSADCVE